MSGEIVTACAITATVGGEPDQALGVRRRYMMTQGDLTRTVVEALMAVWQVEFTLVPRRALAATPRVALPQVMDTDWWSTERFPAAYAQHIAAIASPASSREAELETWGEADGNRVDVWSENGKAARMTARLDVRRLDARFSAMLLRFARIADAVLVRRDGLVVEPTVGAFGAALRTSEAWQYAVDPAAHFASYSDPKDDDP